MTRCVISECYLIGFPCCSACKRRCSNRCENDPERCGLVETEEEYRARLVLLKSMIGSVHAGDSMRKAVAKG